MSIKLYAWRPIGHGPLSYFVAARSKAEAELAVIKYMCDEEIDNDEKGGWPYNFDLKVVAIGEVITNDNS